MTWRRILAGPLAIAAVCLAVYGGARFVRSHGEERADVPAGTYSVEDAAALPIDSRVQVSGFVFIDEQTGALLCSKRKDVDGRPACEGHLLQLRGLDPSRLDMEVADRRQGGYDAWSADEVVLIGEVARVVLRVQDVGRVDG